MHGNQQGGVQTDRSVHGQQWTPRPHTRACDEHRELLRVISAGLEALLEEFYGDGPAHAMSYYDDDGRVVCVLRGGFSHAERTLLAAGHRAAVIEQQTEFRELMIDRVIAVVEDATSQRVIGFMSGDEPSLEIMREVFILTPAGRGDDGAS